MILYLNSFIDFLFFLCVWREDYVHARAGVCQGQRSQHPSRVGATAVVSYPVWVLGSKSLSFAKTEPAPNR